MNIDEMTNGILKGLQGYGEHYNSERAIPNIHDGLKPVQKKLMYAMYLMKLSSKSKYVKAISIPAKTAGFYIHGDAALEEALVRMGQDFKMGNVLVDGGGSWGTHSSLTQPQSGAAAARYRELRISKLAEGMLDSIKHKIVPMIPNFDNTMLEPEYLWFNLPSFLLFAQKGIGVGKATSYCAFTHESVLKFTERVIKNKGIATEEDLKILKPLFTQQPIIINKSEIPKVLAGTSDQKSIRVRAVITQKGNELLITNFPSVSCPEKVVTEIKKKIEKDENHIFANIEDAFDSSFRDKRTKQENVRLELIIKRNTNIDALIETLYKETSLETFVPYNLVLLNKYGKAKKFTVISAMKEWYDLYCEKVQLMLQNKINELENKIIINEGLLKALDIIEEIIELIKSSKNKQEASEKIIARGFNEVQTEAILNMKLVKLANLEKMKIKEELEKLLLEQTSLKETLENENLFTDKLVSLSNSTKGSFTTSYKECKEVDDLRINKQVEKVYYAKLLTNKLMISDKDKRGYIMYNQNQPLNVIKNNEVVCLKDDSWSGKAEAIFTKDMDGSIVTYSKDGNIKRSSVKEMWTTRKAKASNLENTVSVYVNSDDTLEFMYEKLNGKKYKKVMSVSSLKEQGRNTKGVKIAKDIKVVYSIKII